jgi:putative tryptophan/tyrosine transport system substrate-binding protein
MRRRDAFIFFSGTVIFPLLARAQSSQTTTVGFLHSASPQQYGEVVEAFRRGLSETGFIEAQNLIIEQLWAEDENDRLPALAAEFVRRPVAAIAANSVAALVAKRATTTIPIVFQSGVDPVELGLVSGLGHPGGNVTGVSYFASTMEAKKLEVLHELMPQAALIAILVNANNPQAERQVREVQTASRVLGRRILIVRASKPDDFQAAFATMTDQGARALVVVGDPFFNSRRKDLIALATHHAMADIYSNRENVDDGGLMSYGSNLPEAYRQVGIYTGRILKGAKPSELPVLQPTKFEMVINLKTAKALSLTLSPDLLDRADGIIE